jgi:hypothetical protein
MSRYVPYKPDTDRLDGIYDMLPPHLRARDQLSGQALRALLRVIQVQVDIIEDDIARLYENWFIETCDPWAVPYVAALLGYRPLPQPPSGDPRELESERGRRRLLLLTPRREAAHLLSYRRRKGTLAVIEAIARDVSGWVARAVEFRERTAVLQHLNYPLPSRGRLVDLRRGEDLDRGQGPFATLARAADLRPAGPDPDTGRGQIGDIGLYVWAWRTYHVHRALAGKYVPPPGQSCHHVRRCYEYTFSALGNPTALFNRPALLPNPDRSVTEMEVPSPIQRQELRDHPEAFYGLGKSFAIWRGSPEGEPVPVGDLVVADLSRPVVPKPGKIAVDPELGRLALPGPSHRPELWVTYYYGFPADLGGGNYYRPLEYPADACLKLVRQIPRRDDGAPSGAVHTPSPAAGRRDPPYRSLAEALRSWTGLERPQRLIIEVLDDGCYELNGSVKIRPEEHLEIRAGQGCRPLLAVGPDDRSVGHFRPEDPAKGGGHLSLDGFLFAHRQLVLQGPLEGVDIRHCTFVPGLSLDSAGKPACPDEPVLALSGLRGNLSVRRSILGPVTVRSTPGADPGMDRAGAPPRFEFTDSVLDHASGCCPSLGSNGRAVAFARLRVERCTVLGRVEVHALELAQDSLFGARVLVARRGLGCVRFCYVAPQSLTPPRYHCQPEEDLTPPGLVRLWFRSRRYGRPDYVLLAPGTEDKIRRGASDQSEMGVFHDEYFPQRRDNLRARVAEFTPAGAEIQVLFIPD